jgi:serine/threonine protein kinase
MAIEVLRGEGYDFAADWWSVGVMMFEFLVGLPPFYADDTNEVLRQVFHFDSILQNPLDREGVGLISPVPWDLITSLVCEPEVRLGANVGFGKSLVKVVSLSLSLSLSLSSSCSSSLFFFFFLHSGWLSSARLLHCHSGAVLC